MLWKTSIRLKENLTCQLMRYRNIFWIITTKEIWKLKNILVLAICTFVLAFISNFFSNFQTTLCCNWNSVCPISMISFTCAIASFQSGTDLQLIDQRLWVVKCVTLKLQFVVAGRRSVSFLFPLGDKRLVLDAVIAIAIAISTAIAIAIAIVCYFRATRSPREKHFPNFQAINANRKWLCVCAYTALH